MVLKRTSASLSERTLVLRISSATSANATSTSDPSAAMGTMEPRPPLDGQVGSVASTATCTLSWFSMLRMYSENTWPSMLAACMHISGFTPVTLMVMKRVSCTALTPTDMPLGQPGQPRRLQVSRMTSGAWMSSL